MKAIDRSPGTPALSAGVSVFEEHYFLLLI
jgi:hypothetical protein